MEFTNEQLEFIAEQRGIDRTMTVERPLGGGSEVWFRYTASELAAEALRERYRADALARELKDERLLRKSCEAEISFLLTRRDGVQGFVLQPVTRKAITDLLDHEQQPTRSRSLVQENADLKRDLDTAWAEREEWKRRAEKAEAANAERTAPAPSEHVEEVTVDCGAELGQQEVTVSGRWEAIRLLLEWARTGSPERAPVSAKPADPAGSETVAAALLAKMQRWEREHFVAEPVFSEALSADSARPHESLIWAMFLSVQIPALRPGVNLSDLVAVSDRMLAALRARWPEESK